MWYYNFTTSKWRLMNNTNVPRGRMAHSTIRINTAGAAHQHQRHTTHQPGTGAGAGAGGGGGGGVEAICCVGYEELSARFDVAAVLDLQLTRRSFSAADATAKGLRADLQRRMLRAQPTALTAHERGAAGVSKLRFMQWRDERSGLASLGLRVEGLHLPGRPPPPPPPVPADDEPEAAARRVGATLRRLLCALPGGRAVAEARRVRLLQRLDEMAAAIEASARAKGGVFAQWALPGCSMLIIVECGDERLGGGGGGAGAWLVGCSKAERSSVRAPVRHRGAWAAGGHEDGLLDSLDELRSQLALLELDEAGARGGGVVEEICGSVH